MTTAQYIADLKVRVKQLEIGKAFGIAVFTAHSQMTERIFVQGENQNGKKSQYSTELMLASKKQFRKASAFKQSVAASGISFTSNIKSKKTKTIKSKASNKLLWIKFKKAKKAVPIMIIDGGYKEFRQIQGLESSFVNLRYTGQLMKDFANSILRISPLHYQAGIKNKANVGKLEGAEDKYGNVFRLQKDEKAEFLKALTVERLRLQV